MMSHRIPSDDTVQLLEVALDKYLVAHRQKVVLQQVGVNLFGISSQNRCYVVQYPVLSTVQRALHFTSLTDLFTQTPSRLLWEAYATINT